jgi:aminomuconate-semialdehyde/2-hydroxymuconate-6-semialdehyde dehydrogenase
MSTIGHFIFGEERPARSGRTFDDVDPWRQSVRARVAEGDQEDVEAAVSAARQAFDAGPWPRMGFEERGALLHRLADAILENLETLAAADSQDMGKPMTALRAKDVPRAAKNFRFFADHARLAVADRYPMDSGHHAYCQFDPAGVVAAIAPWNFPLMLETWKVAPALAWGNTVVLKPAEDSPASATLLARLAMEVGFPPGVLNVVHGFGPEAAGAFLTNHPGVDRITFTGESNTGRAIGQAAARRLVPVSLELGGKGANLVFEDADLDEAVKWADKAIFTNSGQVCLAGSRLFVQRSILGSFLERFVARTEQHVVGDPARDETTIGPLSSRHHFEKVRSYLDDTSLGGGRILTGGALTDGSWAVKPTVVVDSPVDARICREEVFGPVVNVIPFDDEDEAVRLANDTPYGLNAMLFTENVRRAHRVSRQLRAGTVWVNCFFVRDLRAPFGGVGDSGLGREGGNFSREFFTEPKAVVMEI